MSSPSQFRMRFNSSACGNSSAPTLPQASEQTPAKRFLLSSGVGSFAIADIENEFSGRKWIHAKGSLLIFKKIKVRRFGCSGQVLAGHANECACKVRKPGSGCFVGKNACVK